MLRGHSFDWDRFSGLVSLWRDEPSKVLLWFSSLNSDQRRSFSCSLWVLASPLEACGALVTTFDALVPFTRQVLTTLLVERSAQFDEHLLGHLVEHIAALRLPELMAMQLPKHKRARIQEKEQQEEDEPEEQRLEPFSRSPSLSVANSEDEEVNMQVQEQQAEHAPLLVSESVLESCRDDLRSAAQCVLLGESQTQASVVTLNEEIVQGLAKLEWTEQFAALLGPLSDESLVALFAALGTGLHAAVGTRGKANATRLLLLPRVMSLSGPPSRLLLQVCTELCRDSARVAAAELLVPCVGAGAPQCELTSRCLEQANDENVWTAFVARFLERDNSSATWSDGTLTVLLKAVQNSALSDREVSALLAQMQGQVGAHHGNLRLAKLLLAVVTRFRMSEGSAQAARAVAAQLTSFLAKSVLQKLA
jgi:hypothetical protein